MIPCERCGGTMRPRSELEGWEYVCVNCGDTIDAEQPQQRRPIVRGAARGGRPRLGQGSAR